MCLLGLIAFVACGVWRTVLPCVFAQFRRVVRFAFVFGVLRCLIRAQRMCLCVSVSVCFLWVREEQECVSFIGADWGRQARAGDGRHGNKQTDSTCCSPLSPIGE